MRTSTRVLPQSTFELPVVEPSHREASLKPYLDTRIEELLADKLDWAPPGWKSPEMCGSLSHAPVLRTMRTIPLHLSDFVRVRFLFHAFFVPHSLQYLTVPYLTITLFLVPAKQDAAVAPPKRRLWRLLVPRSVRSPLGVQGRAQSE